MNWYSKYKVAFPLHPKTLQEQGMGIYDVGHKQFDNRPLEDNEEEGIWAMKNNFLIIDIPIRRENRGDFHASLGLNGYRTHIAKGRYTKKNGETIVSLLFFPDNPMIFDAGPHRRRAIKERVIQELDRHFDNPTIMENRNYFEDELV